MIRGFLFNTNYHVIDHEFFMNYMFLEHESCESTHFSLYRFNRFIGFFVLPSISLKGWKDYRRGWSDRREQAPVIPGPNKMSAEGTKDLSPLQGFRMWWYPSPGANTPVCNLHAPSGLLYRSDHTENPCNPFNHLALITFLFLVKMAASLGSILETWLFF